MSERERMGEQALRDSTLTEDLKVLSIEQLEYRLQALETRLPDLTLAEGDELSHLYAFFRMRR